MGKGCFGAPTMDGWAVNMELWEYKALESRNEFLTCCLIKMVGSIVPWEVWESKSSRQVFKDGFFWYHMARVRPSKKRYIVIFESQFLSSKVSVQARVSR